MTSPSRKKPPITPPSIPRSIRFRRFALLIPVLVAGCAILPETASAQNQPIHPGFARLRPAPKPQQHSRFADIANATFFEDSQASHKAPLATPPAPAAMEGHGPFVETLDRADQGFGLTASRPAIQQVQNRRERGLGFDEEFIARPPVNDPRQLKKITEIQPFNSYEPDPLVRAKEPCQHLCPRPDGAPCENLSEFAPACPDEVVLSNEEYIPRCFAENVFAWEASNIYYNPIYFEDIVLERYGHTYPCWLQPFASVGRFGVQLVGLPYQMSIDPVCKKMYPLGYYRPGEPAPKLIYQIPWNTRAALTQAGVTTGLIFLFP